MMQIERKISNTAKQKKLQNHKAVWFNAWQNDKAESLWAAFALDFIGQLSASMPFHRRVAAYARLKFYRFDWANGSWAALRAIAFIATVAGLVIWGLLKSSEIVKDLETFVTFVTTSILQAFLPGGHLVDKAKVTVEIGALVTLVTSAIHHATKIFGNPFTKELKKYASSPDYRSNLNFMMNFKKDFANIVKSYVGTEGRVYVFVDDLDRCDVPGAANLAEALNLLLSASSSNLIFVIGLDRDIVAAGLSAKYAKVLPFLENAGSDNFSGNRRNEYGHAFLEKFIQVPFRVPKPSETAIKSWLLELSSEQNTPPRGAWVEILGHVLIKRFPICRDCDSNSMEVFDDDSALRDFRF